MKLYYSLFVDHKPVADYKAFESAEEFVGVMKRVWASLNPPSPHHCVHGPFCLHPEGDQINFNEFGNVAVILYTPQGARSNRAGSLLEGNPGPELTEIPD